ncbi:hypothetical protein F5Y13DRAFT_197936 [Hypoxylon sp. FL1857]|nr:hypothetical protein F5Y13DRAFT_197936 [Hypoxylon sp. FL1857]
MATPDDVEHEREIAPAHDDNLDIPDLLEECSWWFYKISLTIWHIDAGHDAKTPGEFRSSFGRVSGEISRLERLLGPESLAEFRVMISRDLKPLSDRLMVLDWKISELLGVARIFRAVQADHVEVDPTSPLSIPYSTDIENECTKIARRIDRLKETAQFYGQVAITSRFPKLEDLLDGQHDDLVRYLYLGVMDWVNVKFPRISSEPCIVLAAAMSKHIARLVDSRKPLPKGYRVPPSAGTFLDIGPDPTDIQDHNSQDILPQTSWGGFFICLEHECNERNVIYHRRCQWENHLRRSHPLVWECMEISHGTELPKFASYGQFAAHMRAVHHGSFEESDRCKLRRACSMCLAWSDTEAADENWSRDMLDHMASHFKAMHYLCAEKARGIWLLDT